MPTDLSHLCLLPCTSLYPRSSNWDTQKARSQLLHPQRRQSWYRGTCHLDLHHRDEYQGKCSPLPKEIRPSIGCFGAAVDFESCFSHTPRIFMGSEPEMGSLEEWLNKMNCACSVSHAFGTHFRRFYLTSAYFGRQGGSDMLPGRRK